MATSAVVKPFLRKLRIPYLDVSCDSTIQPGREAAIRTFMYQAHQRFNQSHVFKPNQWIGTWNRKLLSAQDSTISYQVVESMNSRTAEQGTAEYRSEKYWLTAFKNFCCSKFLVRYSIFKIKSEIINHTGFCSACFPFRSSHPFWDRRRSFSVSGRPRAFGRSQP